MKRPLRYPLLDRDSDPGAPRTAARGPRRLLRSHRVRLPVVPSAFTARNGASLRQGLVKRSCSTGLSYGPPDLGPAGFEPATTSLRGCSSTSIRNATSKQTRQGTARRFAMADRSAWGFEPRGSHVVLPAFASNLTSFECSRVATRNPVKPWRWKRCNSTGHSPLDSTHGQVGAACDQIRRSCRPPS